MGIEVGRTVGVSNPQTHNSNNYHANGHNSHGAYGQKTNNSVGQAARQKPANEILAALPTTILERLRPHLRPVLLPTGTVLFEEGRSLQKCYFPSTAIVSYLLTSHDGHDVAVNLVGREGLVGVESIVCGGQSINRAVVQVKGYGLQIPAEVIREEFRRGGVLQDLILQHMHRMLAQSSQIAMCNQLHQVEPRLCRWLLSIHDRLDTNEIRITHEDMACALGVRRSGISIAANGLRESGLIGYSRGRLQILNRQGLEHNACECYTSLNHAMQPAEYKACA